MPAARGLERAVLTRDVVENVPRIGIGLQRIVRLLRAGIGLIAVVPEKGAQDVMERLNAMNEKAFFLGEVLERKNSRSQIKWI